MVYINILDTKLNVCESLEGRRVILKLANRQLQAVGVTQVCVPPVRSSPGTHSLGKTRIRQPFMVALLTVFGVSRVPGQDKECIDI